MNPEVHVKKWKQIATTAVTAALLAGCEKSADSFSLLSDAASFTQNASYVQRPIDILWVIDNSGSMANSQQNLATNFQSFINRFAGLGYDFHMGVTSTDAYLAYHYNQNSRSKLKDGSGTTHSGVFIMDKNTPNLSQVFVTNVKLGTSGSGDERAFSSLEHTLGNPLNAGFRRPGAFLSIIIVSDEEDFSHYDWQNGINSYTFTESYSNLFPISRFTDFLDTLTNSTPGGVRNYSVSTISINDSACLAQLSDNSQKINQRYRQIATATQGSIGSLCGNFGNTLQMISDKVIELSTVFKLDREPYPESIVITVNGETVPASATNGWTYDPATWSISFHGPAVPPAAADVKIYFDPKTVQL